MGGLVGGGYSQMTRPDDQPGDVTFLYGTSFSGGGVILGGTFSAEIALPFAVTVDLLYGFASTTGFANAGNFRREIRLTSHTLRLAALAGLDFEFPGIGFEAGVGPELHFTVASSADEELLGFTTDDAAMRTTDEVWLYLVGQMGIVFDAGPVNVPLLLRAGWNPGYPDTTRDRWDGLSSATEPGALRVGSDWYLSGLVGVRVPL